eukprot:4513785-Alexandrium_andersonii.AAC.1
MPRRWASSSRKSASPLWASTSPAPATPAPRILLPAGPAAGRRAAPAQARQLSPPSRSSRRRSPDAGP